VDPAATYLWRFPPRRLEAEEIRDAMLAVSGDLDFTAGGPHPLEVWPVKKYNLNAPFHEQFDHNRRSVYLLTQRLFENPFLSLFDGPDTNQTTASRDRSHLVTQALYLMNSDFTGARAESFARRIRSSTTDDAGRVVFAFQTAFNREPSSREVKDAISFLARYRTAAPSGPADGEWIALSRSLLVSNEFFFVN
jgi:hypothetical protein